MALYIGGTALLLHFDGPDGSTTMVDSSGGDRLVSSTYGAALSAAASRFGGTSLALNGVNAHLRTTQTGQAEYQFGTGAFTIECWACLQNTAGIRCLIDFNESSPFRVVWSGSQLQVHSGHGSVLSSADLTWDPATFYHVALVRVGSEVTLYRDGQPLGTWVTSASLDLPPGRTVFIGCNRGDTWFWQGFIDELRIVNGVALYLGPFTPPEAPLSVITGTAVATQVLGGGVDFSGSRFVTDNPTLGGTRVAIRWHSIGLQRLVRFDPSVIPLPIKAMTVDLRDRFPYGLYLAPTPALHALPQDGYGNRPWPWEFKGTGRVIGTVKEVGVQSNLPVHRRVRLYRERDGALVREVWSDAASGNYAFNGVPLSERYTVLSHDHRLNFRAVIADNLTPEPML